MLKAMFVYTFDSGVNFCGENFFCGNYFPREPFFWIVKEPQKSQKLEPAIRKN